MLLGISGCFPAPAPPTVLYVSATAADGGNGLTWESAFQRLDTALETAAETDSVAEIWVAAGSYRPTADADRSATFQLLNGVAIYGGFAGGETSRDERNSEANLTVLTGDLLGDDANGGSPAENSYHVVTASGTDETAILDGFTITAGNANESGNSSGAGILCDASDAQISNCRIVGNTAQNSGGGIIILDGNATLRACTIQGNVAVSNGGGISLVNAAPTIEDCAILENLALGNGGGMVVANAPATMRRCTFRDNSGVAGGAVYIGDAGAPEFDACSFTSNAAETDGGAVANVVNVQAQFTSCTFLQNSAARSGGAVINSVNANPTFLGCRFVGNSAASSGGAMFNFQSSPVLVNGAFSGNSAALGGAVGNRDAAAPTVTNCSFSGNSATSGGGVYNSFESSPVIVNCILWANTEIGGQLRTQQIRTESGTPVVNFTCIQDGWDGAGGEGIVAADPLFVAAAGADGAFGTEDDDMRLQAGSPCVDAGLNDVDVDPATEGVQPLPETDLLGTPRIRDGNADGTAAVDLGAYES